MAAAQGDSPAVARRRVRLALRKSREATALSQGDVARRLGWSLSKMQRIESGEVTVSGTDLRALLDVYGVADQDRIARLMEDSRISRRERWWTAPEFREHLTPAMLQLLQFEADATAIWVYQPHLIPGILQTSESAKAILAWWKVTLSDDERRVRYDARMQRRRQILERPDPPNFSLILDESVIMRKVGGVSAMVEQLAALNDLAGRPNVRIRIVSLDDGGIAGMVGPFTILDLAEGDLEDAVLYRESDLRDALIHDVEQVKRYRGIFSQIWESAYDESVSRRRIEAEAAVLRSSLDRM